MSHVNGMIVFQTDFSLNWPFIATMKGVCMQIDPNLKLFDGVHTITAFSILEASQQLAYLEPFFPKGTCYVSVVDPGVGTNRKACCALLKDGRYVITPDNGSLTHVASQVGIEAIREIDPQHRYLGTEDVSVFHGRDIFAYTAALLESKKITFEEVGEAYDVNDVILLDPEYLRAPVTSSYIQGFVSNVSDPFGSIVFNIQTDDFKQVGYTLHTKVHITLKKDGNIYFDEDVYYGEAFGDVAINAPILFNSSSSYISLGLNQGSFRDQYHVLTGKNYTVEIRPL